MVSRTAIIRYLGEHPGCTRGELAREGCGTTHIDRKFTEALKALLDSKEVHIEPGRDKPYNPPFATFWPGPYPRLD